MRVVFPLVAFVTFSLASLGMSVSAFQDAAIAAPDIQLELEQLGAPTCPYQAVRIRVGIRNVSSKRIGPPLLPIDDSLGYCLMKGPNQSSYRAIRAYIMIPGSRRFAITPRGHMNGSAQLFLEPKERTSASFAIAAEWSDKAGNPFPEGSCEPLFPEPGLYSLKFRYLLDAKTYTYKEAAIAINVAVPRGDEKVVFDLLKTDAKLATTLMQSVDTPDKTVVPKLKNIVERYPETSYAAYARFALARGYLKGIEVSPFSERVAFAFAADQLEKVIQDRYNAGQKKVVPSDFAYLPDTLMLMKLVEPQAKKNILLRLHREFSDDLGWLEEFASLLTAADQRREDREFLLKRQYPPDPQEAAAMKAEEWVKFRKQAPVPRKREEIAP